MVVESLRDAGTTLAIQVVPFGVEERLLISRNITQIEAVARMRRDFIANVSHELKTPLTVVSGFLETLQDLDLEPAQRTRFMQLMTEQARSMQRLVDDLLTLSALESEQNAVVESTFDVVPLLLELSADGKALSDAAPGRPRHPRTGDGRGQSRRARERVRQSRQQRGPLYAGRRDHIARLATSMIRGEACSASPTRASASPPDHIPRLTERFYRVDRSRSRATGGTGLGLAIVKHVLLRHQAELDVMSELGKGSTFAVILPASRIRRPLADGPDDASVAGLADLPGEPSDSPPAR